MIEHTLGPPDDASDPHTNPPVGSGPSSWDQQCEAVRQQLATTDQDLDSPSGLTKRQVIEFMHYFAVAGHVYGSNTPLAVVAQQHNKHFAQSPPAAMRAYLRRLNAYIAQGCVFNEETLRA